MQSSPTRHSRSRFLVPRFSLRSLLVCAAVIAVLIEVGQRTWPRLVRYHQARQYTSLQETKQWPITSLQSFVIDEGRGVPDHFAILVRRGNTFGCFIPHNQNKKGESVEYDWYYRTDGLGRFDPDDPQVKSGHSFAGPYVSGGPSILIEFGPFSIPWSGHAPGWGYVYYDYNPDPPDRSAPDVLRITSTDVKSLDLIDARDQQWVYRSHPRDAGLRGDQDAKAKPVAVERD